MGIVTSTQHEVIVEQNKNNNAIIIKEVPTGIVQQQKKLFKEQPNKIKVPETTKEIIVRDIPKVNILREETKVLNEEPVVQIVPKENILEDSKGNLVKGEPRENILKEEPKRNAVRDEPRENIPKEEPRESIKEGSDNSNGKGDSLNENKTSKIILEKEKLSEALVSSKGNNLDEPVISKVIELQTKDIVQYLKGNTDDRYKLEVHKEFKKIEEKIIIPEHNQTQGNLPLKNGHSAEVIIKFLDPMAIEEPIESRSWTLKPISNGIYSRGNPKYDDKQLITSPEQLESLEQKELIDTCKEFKITIISEDKYVLIGALLILFPPESINSYIKGVQDLHILEKLCHGANLPITIREIMMKNIIKHTESHNQSQQIFINSFKTPTKKRPREDDQTPSPTKRIKHDSPMKVIVRQSPTQQDKKTILPTSEPNGDIIWSDNFTVNDIDLKVKVVQSRSPSNKYLQ